MAQESLNRLEHLFQEALEREPDERAAFLAATCGDDPALRREIESLLQADEEANAEGFLEDSVWPPLRDEPPAVLDGRDGTRTDPSPSEDQKSTPHEPARSSASPEFAVEQYEILEEVGSGGMGVVFKARDVRLGRIVALKFLPPSRRGRTEATQRFLQEARVASALDHPNICTIYEIGEMEGNRLYIAMACYDGETLRDKIEGGPLPLPDALDYAVQIAAGLQRAHEAGIVHRDVKPANVMVTDSGLVKLVDFGVAKMKNASVTRTGAAIGTVAYMSPEQIKGMPVDELADLWALSVVLYEMLTGQRPFCSPNDFANFYAIVHDEPARATTLQPGLPSSLDAFFARALDKNPELRFQSARELAQALGRIQASRMGRGTELQTVLEGRTHTGNATSPTLIGRTDEREFLHRQLGRALNRERRIVFITAETGVGKTTLVDAFLDRAGPTRDLLIGRGQCIEHRGEGEPYLPVLDGLNRLCKGPHGAALLGVLEEYAPTWLVQMPWLLDDTGLERLKGRVLGTTRERMLREFVEALEHVTTEIAPLILVLEDLHWSDASTIQLIDGLARRREPARLLVLGTSRPPDQSGTEPLFSTTKQDLCLRNCATERTLELLSETEATAFLHRHLGGTPPAGLSRVLHQRTGGHPLFMRHVIDDWKAKGAILDDDGPWTVTVDLEALAVGVPDTLREMIEQQLNRLPPDEQQVLEAAGIVGWAFSAAAVAAGLDADEAVVERQCTRLARTRSFLGVEGLAEWPDGTVSTQFHFLHTLYQDVLYDRVPAGQRVRLHRKIGVRLESGYGEMASSHAAEIALHFTRGREPERAVFYLQEAAHRALRRSAHREAIHHLTTALDLLHTLPETADRDRREIVLQTMLGTANIVTKGWGASEAERAYEQARTLGRRLGTPTDLVPVLFSMASMYELRGEYHKSQALLEERFGLSPGPAEEEAMVGSHELFACSMFHQGAFERALEHAEQGLRLYNPDQQYALLATYGDDPGVSCHDWAALSLWFLGWPDQALERALEAIRLAKTHHYSLATAQMRAGWIYQCRGEIGPTQHWTERAIDLATQQGFPYQQAVATILNGWAQAMQGDGDEGIDLLREGMAACRAAGAEMDRPYFAALLAEAYGRNEQVKEGLAAVEEALDRVQNGRSYFYEPDLHRLKGTLHLQRGGPTDRSAAEAAFLLAYERARDLDSPILSLRAATAVAQLWHATDRAAEGVSLLDEAYRHFTEGFDTPDLTRARVLLERLRGS